MQVAPLGCVAIPDAIGAILKAFYPTYSEEMQAYDSASEYGREAEDLLLSGLLSEPGLALAFKDGGPVLKLPLDYWATPGGPITLHSGRVVGNQFTFEDLADFHEQPCFLSESRFNFWLQRMRELSQPYWTYWMVLIWVYSRDRVLVRKAAPQNGTRHRPCSCH